MAVFHTVPTLIMCSVTTGSTGQKLYTHKQLELNTKNNINIAHTVYPNTEIKVKKVQSQCGTSDPCLFVLQIIQHIMTLHHAEMNGSAVGMSHRLILHVSLQKC